MLGHAVSVECARPTANGDKVSDWIAALASPDPNQRAAAACALGEVGEEADAAIPALARLLGDEAMASDFPCKDGREVGSHRNGTVSVGEVAAVSLARINGPAVDALISALGDSNWFARQNAALGLGVSGSERAAEPLVIALADSVWQVRARSAWALGLQGNDHAVEPLVGALRDTSDEVRSQAAWALGLKGDERAVEPLAGALEDRSPTVRSQAAWALGLKGDERAVEPLIGRLGDESAEVAAQAAWALGLKGDRRALGPLTQALKSSSADVREKAAWALGLISSRNGEPGPQINANPRPNISTRKHGAN
jgi:HEAT repeat protein